MRRQREKGRSDRAYVVINGKRRKLGVWGSQEAEQRYRELIAQPDEQSAPRLPEPPPPAETVTVAEIMVPFMRHVLKTYAKNKAEIAHYRGSMRVVMADCGELAATMFGPKRLRRVREAMVELGWSRRYVNGQIGRVKRLFKWAASEEVIPASVATSLATVEGLRAGRTVAKDPERVEPVDDAVVEQTLPFVNPTVRDMIAVQRLCGCRPGELCAMAAEFIDRSGDVWIFTPPSHKTRHHGKSRTIALGPRAQAILQKYLFSDGPFFNYRTDTFRQVIRRACDRAFPAPEGLSAADRRAWQKSRRWKPNQLRHTCATAVREESGLEAAQHVLGHSRADVTQIYAERSARQATDLARSIG